MKSIAIMQDASSDEGLLNTPSLSLLVALALPLLLFIAGCHSSLRNAPPMQFAVGYRPLPAVDPLVGNMVPVHDPAITRRPDGTWVALSTDIPFLRSEHFLERRCSADLIHWHGCGYLFDALPAWVSRQHPKAVGLWAPDISHFGGRYHLYYAVSLFGTQQSAIGHAVSSTLSSQDHWQDTGPILHSTKGDPFNAIDPNVFVEEAAGSRREQVWLTYGSFWGGLYQQQVDPRTGSLIPGGTRYHLAQQPGRRRGALEGASLIGHNGWYYLFASVGLCCESPIERDTYQEIVGRSRSPHGPFVDQHGQLMLKGGGTILLSGDRNWLAPGGGSLWQSPDAQRTLIAFHSLERAHNGALDLWVQEVSWPNDWPTLEPIPTTN